MGKYSWTCKYKKPALPGASGDTVCKIGRNGIILHDSPEVLRLPPGKQCVKMPDGTTHCLMKHSPGARGNPRQVWTT